MGNLTTTELAPLRVMSPQGAPAGRTSVRIGEVQVSQPPCECGSARARNIAAVGHSQDLLPEDGAAVPVEHGDRRGPRVAANPFRAVDPVPGPSGVGLEDLELQLADPPLALQSALSGDGLDLTVAQVRWPRSESPIVTAPAGK